MGDDRRPETPRSPGEERQDDAENGEAEELESLEVHQSEDEAGHDDRHRRTELRPEGGEATEKSPQQEPAEEELLHHRAADADEERHDDELGRTARLGRAEELLGRMPELLCQVRDERLERELEERDEKELGRDTYGDAEGYVRKRAQAHAEVAQEGAGAPADGLGTSRTRDSDGRRGSSNP